MTDDDQNLKQTAEEVEKQQQEETPEETAESTENTPEEKTQEQASEDQVQGTTSAEEKAEEEVAEPVEEAIEEAEEATTNPDAKWYVVHTYSGHENRVAATLKQRVESEHLEDKIVDVLVPTQEKIEIRSGKKETVKEKIFPGYILVKMVLDDESWLAVRTTQGITSFIGMSSKPTPISEREVQSIVTFMKQGGQPTYKQIFTEGDTVKIVDGPFAEFIGKIESVDKERGKIKVLVSIFGRETPVELDFLQVAKL
ncbi:MAG: transcription termination/antitermination protein NusG [Patescibacteria group bacterium]|nr:transcription termination/antitermination protein NusG [Patescibacteria group bacterium]